MKSSLTEVSKRHLCKYILSPRLCTSVPCSEYSIVCSQESSRKTCLDVILLSQAMQETKRVEQIRAKLLCPKIPWFNGDVLPYLYEQLLSFRVSRSLYILGVIVCGRESLK